MSIALAALGALGDVVMSVATGPLDRVTLVLQSHSLPSSARKGVLYAGLRDCARELREQGGLLGLWKGSGAELGKSYAMALAQVGLKVMRAPGGAPAQGKRRALAKALRSSLSLLAAYPLTLARVRLATSADAADGTLHTWRRVAAKGGWRALYAGVVPELLADALHRLVFYMGAAAVRHELLGISDTAVSRFLGTQLAGLAALLIAFPLRTVHVRMAVESGDDEARGVMEWRKAAKKLYDDEGINGFYRGLLPAWLSQVIKNGIFYNGVWLAADMLLRDGFQPDQLVEDITLEAVPIKALPTAAQ